MVISLKICSSMRSSTNTSGLCPRSEMTCGSCPLKGPHQRTCWCCATGFEIKISSILASSWMTVKGPVCASLVCCSLLIQYSDGGALYKLVDPSILIRQREERAALAADKAAKKSGNAAAVEAKRIAIIEKGRVPPTEMFKPPNVEEGVWTVWDEQGIPTTDGEGKEISKAASKKCLKEWKLQGKAHEAYLAWKQEGK